MRIDMTLLTGNLQHEERATSWEIGEEELYINISNRMSCLCYYSPDLDLHVLL